MPITFGSDIWGVDQGLGFNCSYDQFATISGRFMRSDTVRFARDADGIVSTTNRRETAFTDNISDFLLSSTDTGSSADVCQSSFQSGVFTYILTGTEDVISSTGLFEVRDAVTLFIAFFFSIVIFYAAWKHIRFSGLEGEGTLRLDEPLVTFYNSEGNERYYEHPLAKWRRNQ